MNKRLNGAAGSQELDAYSRDRLQQLVWNNDELHGFMTDDRYAMNGLGGSGFSNTRPDGTSILVDMRNNLGPAFGSGGGRTGS